jgi:phosphate transport system protein
MATVEVRHDHPNAHVASRAALRGALASAEKRTNAELDAMRELLRLAIRDVTDGERGLGDEVMGRSADMKRRYDEVHDGLLSLIALQTPVATDLRLAVALLHINDNAERMAAQCANIVTLRRALPDETSPSPEQVDCLAAMARLADEQIAEAVGVFGRRDTAGAERLMQNDLEINEHNL